jgi:hypothetical protein
LGKEGGLDRHLAFLPLPFSQAVEHVRCRYHLGALVVRRNAVPPHTCPGQPHPITSPRTSCRLFIRPSADCLCSSSLLALSRLRSPFHHVVAARSYATEAKAQVGQIKTVIGAVVDVQFDTEVRLSPPLPPLPLAL